MISHFPIAARLTLVLCLSLGLGAQDVAGQAAGRETVAPPTVVPTPPVSPALARSSVPFDAPAPEPVTAAEQAELEVPRRADTPPRSGPEATRPFPWRGGLLGANSLPSLGLAPLLELGGSWSQPSATSCTIRFDNYIGLLILPDRAGYTFASSPFYIEGCGSGWVHVKENDVARYGANWGSSYAHYHLMYEKGAYCIPSGGNYGYQSGSSCVKVTDPATEPRYLASHHGTQWVRVYVYKSGVAEMTFDFKSIRVKGAQGIKLYFRKADGSWWHWNNLGTGTWNVAPYASGIREVLMRASNNSSSSYSIDNIGVAVN